MAFLVTFSEVVLFVVALLTGGAVLAVYGYRAQSTALLILGSLLSLLWLLVVLVVIALRICDPTCAAAP